MRVPVRDVTLYFDVEGPEFDVDETLVQPRRQAVLLPGGPGQSHLHHRHHPPVPPTLAQLIHLEHRGTGRSDPSDKSKWNLETWAADVAAFIEVLELDRPILAGSSFGAIVALATAARFPDHISALILASPVARFDARASVAVFERLGGSAARDAAAAFFANPNLENAIQYNETCGPLYVRNPAFDTSHSDFDPLNGRLAMHWSAGEAKRLDLRPELSSVRVPTLIAAGVDDPMCPVSLAEEVATGITGARLAIFKDAGHLPAHDSPVEYSTVVEDFLTRG